MTKKVVHITTVHRPDDVRIYRKEVFSLAKAGYNVVLIAPRRGAQDLAVEFVPIPHRRSRIGRIALGTVRAGVAALRQKGNVYHIHDPELLPIALLLKILGHAAIVYDVHENYAAALLSRPWLPRIIRKIVSKSFNRIEKWVARFFDLVVTATEDIAYGFLGSKVIVVKNYPLCSCSDDLLVEKQARERPTVIYVGGLSKSDGIEQVVCAVNLLKADCLVQLRLVGEFSDLAFKLKLQQKYSLCDSELPGWLTAEKVVKELLLADIGVVCPLPDPNNINALPNKLFEYMCYGLPVVASNFGNIAAVVEENTCGVIVDPLQPKEIAKGIRYLIEHPEEAVAMGQRGQKAVQHQYRWDSEARKLLNAYRGLPGDEA